MNRRAKIGFDRKLELEWLDLTAARASEGASSESVRDYLLTQLVSLSFSNESSGSARAKTARVLLRIWGGVAPELEPLQRHALDLLPQLRADQRLALHWAMTMAAYPFFTDHAAVIGRLFSLQDYCTTAQVQRRVSEQWGERETVLRTSRHVVRTMVAWGVIEDAEKGAYRRKGERLSVTGELGQLLVEAVLLDSESEALPLEQAARHPALFPFDVRLNGQALRNSGRVRVFRHGLDQDFIALPE